MAAADAPVLDIPDKAYFRIGEVSRLVGVDTHVLRYWESEFAIIKPFRGKSKQRLYRRQDVDNLLLVKQLLHEQGYTIAGAKKVLAVPKAIKQAPERVSAASMAAPKELDTGNEQDSGNSTVVPATGELVETIRVELCALQQLLTRKSEP